MGAMNERFAVHHVAVVTRDLERSARFYEGVLGLPVVRRLDDAAGRPRALWLGLGGGAFLAIELAAVVGSSSLAKDDASPGFHCLALAIERAEREPLRAHLAAAGFPVERETAFTIYTRDPDGALVGLSHYPEPSG